MLKKINLSGIVKTVKSVATIGLVVMAFVKAFQVLADELDKISPETNENKTENNE